MGPEQLSSLAHKYPLPLNAAITAVLKLISVVVGGGSQHWPTELMLSSQDAQTGISISGLASHLKNKVGDRQQRKAGPILGDLCTASNGSGKR